MITILTIYVDNEADGLEVEFLENYKEHEYAEQLHTCKDGTMRRPESYDPDAADCHWFIDGKDIDGKDIDNLDDDASDHFSEVMDKAWDLLEKIGALTDDGCLPEGSYGNLYTR